MPKKSVTKPPLYQGHAISLNQLTPDDFEDFTYQCLTILGEHIGFEMQSGRQPAADQGYDCIAKTLNTNNIVCIQCKRYPSTSLSVDIIAKEIIKVALDAATNGSIVEQQYIITSGTVAGNLRKALRQDSYKDIKSKCKEIITNGDFQPSVLEEIKELGLSSYTVVSDYLDNIKKLKVWSGTDFTSNLLIVWDQLTNIIEKHYAVEKVLKDSPTPNFNTVEYCKNVANKGNQFVGLWYSNTDLPNNLNSNTPVETIGSGFISTNDIASLLKSGNNVVLSSLGGSGKSSTLINLASTLVKDEFDIEFLPVLVKLRSYSRGNLDKAINQSLNISYGSWRSLPYKFILLLDGLDEMLQSDTQAFFDELSAIIGNNAFILSSRNTGVSVETHADKLDLCLEITPLSYRDVVNISSKSMLEHEQKEFCDLYRDKIGSFGFNFLFSPFALSLSIKYYQDCGKLPESLKKMIENWIDSKVKIDKSRIKTTSLVINKLPNFKVKEAFSLVTYKAIFQKGLTSLSEADYWELLNETYNELTNQGLSVTKMLSFDSFLELLEQHEIYTKDNDGVYSTPHKIISEYLASIELSKNWRSHKKSYLESEYDIWLYCSTFINDEEKQEFIEFMFECDLSLATKIAKQYGGEFIEFVEGRILELEQNFEVITRSNAIYSLGILGTKKCIERLKSNEGLLDPHHQYQRRRALAINGDRGTLISILSDNEVKAQMPIKISGGEYDIWFQCPPTLITEIARERLNTWKNDQTTPVCMSLRTLRIFGDTSDISNIKVILLETSKEQEFNDAAAALYSIDNECLIELLELLAEPSNDKSYWAKKNLTALNFNCNIDDEINFFIEQGLKSHEELSEQNYMYGMYSFVEFICKNKITDENIEKLIIAYRKLNFSSEFYYCNLFWHIANSTKSDKFMPLVESAYLRNNSSEINNAIAYLASLDYLDISSKLKNKIDDYFKSLDRELKGIYHNYIHYYFKHGSKDFAKSYLIDEFNSTFATLDPQTITREQYISFDFTNASTFHMLSKYVSEIDLSTEMSLKFLLVCSEHMADIALSKYSILNKIDKATLDNYAEQITDDSVRISEVSYLLKNNLSSMPLIQLEKYLPYFLSHHMYYPTLEALYNKYWNDNLAHSFLTHFITHNWSDVSAQMFDKYTNFFLTLFTKEQLEEFESQRTTDVNVYIERIYRIWLGLYKVHYQKL
ncbi:restriction endonuclease [Vibrio cholerae]|uniref:restriction endonuclease n=1 Tax=Vibrio cholerae TaxID=666 RepID=UPI001C639B0D|nr:restriction endonuclease [Vibrio cholerae]ELF1352005.1 restriction endonuclease [Vibrio cholerae]ELJ8474200.1 restriction endonuclease [Vibrio cholerae]